MPGIPNATPGTTRGTAPPPAPPRPAPRMMERQRNADDMGMPMPIVPVVRRLNLGCGSKLMPTSEGWLNLDLHQLPGVDVVHDMRRGLPFPDGHFEEVLALDVLEHVLRAEQGPLLAEVHRVLAPGGVFKGKTPNLEALAKALLDAKVPPEEYERKVYANQGGGLEGGDVHMSGNTPASLRLRLTTVGFRVDRVTPTLPGEDWSNMAWRATRPAPGGANPGP